jgi:hypothetical protein
MEVKQDSNQHHSGWKVRAEKVNRVSSDMNSDRAIRVNRLGTEPHNRSIRTQNGPLGIEHVLGEDDSSNLRRLQFENDNLEVGDRRCVGGNLGSRSTSF